MVDDAFDTVPDSFLSEADALGLAFDAGDLDRLRGYLRLLYDANQRMNLTAIRDPAEAWSRHVLDSLTLLPWVAATIERAESEGRSASLIDVGSGGGLPGLVLACVQPELRIVLVEATGKKARFLAQASAALGLDRIEVLPQRAEEVGRDPEHRETHDLVTSRAVGALNVLAEYLVPLARPDATILAIKGAKAEEEIETAKQALYKLHASVVEVHPTSTGRIVVIEKNRAVPKAYPREVGEPKRRPLA
jgi:16S rRNA (guanine527-N7)-methyltransferase